MEITSEDTILTRVSEFDIITTKWEEGYNGGTAEHRKKVVEYMAKGWQVVGDSFVHLENTWIFRTAVVK